MSRSWASREANAAGTRIMIAQVFELNRERMNEVFEHVLEVIQDALNARKIFVAMMYTNGMPRSPKAAVE